MDRVESSKTMQNSAKLQCISPVVHGTLGQWQTRKTQTPTADQFEVLCVHQGSVSGLTCVVINVLLYGSPLSVMNKVIKTKSVECFGSEKCELFCV